MALLGLLPWLVVALPVLLLFSVFQKRIQFNLRAKSHGCAPAVHNSHPAWDPLGITNMQHVKAADTSKKFPRWVMSVMESLSKREGRPVTTFTMDVLGVTFVLSCDPKNVQAVLATQFNDFEIGNLRRDSFWPLLGKGIFTSDGKQWSHARALLRPTFARDQVSDLESTNTHTHNLVRALTKFSANYTKPVDLSPLFFRYTIDSATQFLFGTSCDSQLAIMGESTGNGNDFASAFDVAQEYLNDRIKLGDLHWTINPPEFKKSCKDCHEFIDRYVYAALERRAQGKVSADSKYLFLDELAAETQDPLELRYQLLHILLAGRDTTASSLGWTFMLLSRHPSVYAKLRDAVLTTFGPASNAPSTLTFTALKGCTYLQHVLSESLRLFPVVPLNSRIATRDTTLPRGGGPDGTAPTFVPKGTHVGYSVYIMHRDPSLWGADAECFRPERWEGKRAGWDFLPFNGGPRVCLGQQFALTNMGYAVVRIVQAVESLAWMGTECGEPHAQGTTLGRGANGESVGDPRLNAKLTMKLDGGCWVAMQSAAE